MRKEMVKQDVAFLQPNTEGQYYMFGSRTTLQPSERHANLTKIVCWALQNLAVQNSSYLGGEINQI